MNQVNWDEYKFHCSALKNLMVTPRLKSEVLSETTKSFLNDIYIKEVFGREKSEMVANKYVRKGVMCETDSLELLERVKGEKHFKNNKMLENAYIVGTPDIITLDKIKDIKTSWDLFTFFGVDEDQAQRDYYYQLLGYMILTGKKYAELVYCLVNTPEQMMNDELYRLKFYLPEEEAESYDINYIFDDIPEERRIKVFSFEYIKEEAELLEGKIKLSRVYLSALSSK